MCLDIKSSYHPADDTPLLIILLPEHSDVRLDDVEQLGDDGGHAAEEHGPTAPAQPLLQLLHSNPRLVRMPTGLLQAGDRDAGAVTAAANVEVRGAEDCSDGAGGGELAEVPGEVGGVGGEVLGGRELAGVDVDGDDDGDGAGGGGHGGGDEGEMAVVEEAHGGYEGDGLPFSAAASRPGAHRRLVADHLRFGGRHGMGHGIWEQQVKREVEGRFESGSRLGKEKDKTLCRGRCTRMGLGGSGG